jgi:hypothetical protein
MSTLHATVHHHLVGYDPKSEKLVFSMEIPEKFVGKIVRFERDDPAGYDSYRVDYSHAMEFAAVVLGKKIPVGLEYFVEAF